MKLRENKSLFTLLVIALLVLFSFTFIYFNSSQNTTKPNTQEQIVHHIDGSLAYVSISDLFNDSTLIVEGTISDKSDAFQIESISGSIANFSDYQFDISSVLRGNLSDDADSVEIRVQGGTVGNYTEIYSGIPDFNIGDNYLVFLYQPGRGGSFNTEGDYYYVLGLCQGVFSLNEHGQYISQSGEELSNDYLIQTLSTDDEPVDPDYFRNEYIENQRRNLENGFISQDEFDQLMRNIDNYATIVS